MKYLKSTLLLIQLVVVIICVSINEAQESEYIVGGVNAEPGEIPYQVSLQYRKQHICGGSILNSCWILTAAHCVVGYSQPYLTVVAGITKLSGRGIRDQIAKIIPHEKYKSGSTNNIALIKLLYCLPFHKNIQPLKLLTNNIGPGVIGIVSGWGFTDQNGNQTTNDLKKLRVTTISNQQCSKSFRDIFIGNLCTLNVVGEGFCKGDGGGPLVEEKSKAQIGVVSSNIPCARGNPDIYTRVSNYIKWIQDNAK